MGPRLHVLAGAALALLLTPATAVQVCHDEPAPNLLVNPSFENGLASWQVNAGTTQSGIGSDGSAYYAMPGAQTIRTAIQQVNTLVVGSQYTLSADIQPYLDPSASVSFKSCIVGIVRISASGSSTVVSVQRTITKTATAWESMSGLWTADGTSATFELAASCAGSTTAALQLRWDNTVMRSTLPVEVCETQPDPTTVEPEPPITTSSSLPSLPTTLEIITTSSVAFATTSSSSPATTSGVKACRAKKNVRRRRWQL